MDCKTQFFSEIQLQKLGGWKKMKENHSVEQDPLPACT